MSSLFGKKRSSSLHRQRPSQPPTPSATTAAAQAFLKKQSDEAQLSNAAAAAALRSHTPTPTPVGDVQTKRMMRRGSSSSLGSGTSNSRQPFTSDLQRKGSNGSMTHRTFRSPSPGSRGGTPPVPAIPAELPPLPNNAPSVPAKSNKRNSNLETSARVVSPPVTTKQRPQSMESSRWAPSKSHPNAEPISGTREQGSTSPTSPVGSPRNINFSRPMSPQLTSPVPHSSSRDEPQSPTNIPPAQPATSLGLTSEQYRRLEERREAARLQEEEWIERERRRNEAQTIARQNAPASRPQPSSGPISATASADATPPKPRPLSSGGNDSKGLSSSAYSPTRTSPRVQPRASGPEPKNTRPVSMPTAVDTAVTTPVPQHLPRARQPEPKLDTSHTRSNNNQQPAQMTPSLRSTTERTDAIPSPTSDQIKSFQTRAASLLARPLNDGDSRPSDPTPSSRTKGVEGVKQHNRAVSSPVTSQHQGLGVDRGREPSASPARSARFSESPLLGGTKHNPPPRSVSPVKSAMKGSSPRTVSPNITHRRDVADLSDTRSLASDEGSTPSEKRRKSVRVSFEERPVTVGQAAGGTDSPVDTIMSPQYKKQLREAKTDGEQDFTMAPRPVLPSFGSIRGRKIRQPDSTEHEKMDLKDLETDEAKPLRDAMESLRNDDESEEFVPSERAPAVKDTDTSTKLTAPQIAVLPATPRFEDKDQFEKSSGEQSPEYAGDLEGALSAEDAPSAADSHPKHVVDENELPSHEEGTVNQQDLGELPLMEKIIAAPTQDDDSDSDEGVNDQFSDSVQDQSELDTGGFASLDAILESPGGEAAAQLGEPPADDSSKVPAIATAEPAPATIAVPTDNAQPAPEGGPQEDWNSAKAYWSSLSDQQKLAMEKNHQPAANTSSTRESTVKAAKPKSVPQKSSKPPKPALKKTNPTHERASSDSIHFRYSMRSSGSMMSSMRGPPERSPTRSGPQQRPRRSSAPQASAEAIAIAQATAKSMAAKDAERRASAEDEKEQSKRGRAPPKDFHHSMKRSMRDGQSLTQTSSKPVPSTGRHSVDMGQESKSSGFLSFGKSKSKAQKSKKASGGSGGGTSNRFKSRFADSSDEDSDGGGFASRLNFRSRFADSDDSSDNEATTRRNPIKLAPVRGIPRQRGQEEGESTELEDSDDEVQPQKANNNHDFRRPRSSKDRPGTPPTSQVLSFGKSPGPAGIDVPKEPSTPEKRDVKPPPTPSSPHANEPTANGHIAEGKALAAGTLRKSDVEKGSEKRHSLLGLGKRPKSADNKRGGLSESKWANTPSSPHSQSHTPLHGSAKTLRDSKDSKEKGKRNSVLHRLSIGGRDSGASTPTSPAGTKIGKDEFPFPPPPIPEEYRSPTGPQDNKRPNTSDGVGGQNSSKDNTPTTSPQSKQRPSMGEKRVSTMTAPTRVESGEGRARQDPIFSSRTGKKKRFQGLRRAFGLND